MTLGQNIKKFRRNADMTQEELAEMLCISSQAVSRWEVGTAMPDISLLPALCNIFNVSSDELLGIDSSQQQGVIDEIRAKDYDLTINKYREVEREVIVHRSTDEIMRDIENSKKNEDEAIKELLKLMKED